MAKELTFIKNLDAEQIEYAMKVRQAADALGVNPTLALAIAYHESRFRPNVKRGEDGEVGLMQIKPSTAAGLGYTMQDILKPEKNIEAGVKYIKEALDVTGNDMRLAPIYYNGGPTTFGKFASGQDYDPKVDGYLKALKSYNTFEAFDPSQLTEPKAPSSTPIPKVEVKDPTKAEMQFEEQGQKELTRDEFGLYGGAAGAAAAASAAGAPLATNMATKTIGNILAQVQQAKAQNMPPAAPQGPTGGFPAGGAPATPQMPTGAPMGGLPSTQRGAPIGPADAGRMAQGQTGVIPYNTSKALGLTDIEAGQALSNTKQQGGAWDLAEKRREAMTRIQGMGGNNFVENPRFGGIMTQAPSVGGGPRESFVMRPEVPASPDLPTGQPSQLAPLPKAPAIPTVAPPPSGLEQAKNMFTSMMRQTAKVLPYVAAPVAGYSLGRDVADLYMGYEQPKEERDYLDLGLTGLGALATMGSYTPLAPVAIPASIAAPAVRNLRRTLIEKAQSPEEQAFINREPTEEELLMARQPAFRYARP
jgi:hypothetical protein